MGLFMDLFYYPVRGRRRRREGDLRRVRVAGDSDGAYRPLRWRACQGRHDPCRTQLTRPDLEETMDARDAIERKDSYLRMMERIPTQGYLGAALGSIALSALLRLFGKKDAAVFVGQWPPTFILFALAHKLLQPSTE
jgi:hypothetical protein